MKPVSSWYRSGRRWEFYTCVRVRVFVLLCNANHHSFCPDQWPWPVDLIDHLCNVLAHLAPPDNEVGVFIERWCWLKVARCDHQSWAGSDIYGGVVTALTSSPSSLTLLITQSNYRPARVVPGGGVLQAQRNFAVDFTIFSEDYH